MQVRGLVGSAESSCRLLRGCPRSTRSLTNEQDSSLLVPPTMEGRNSSALALEVVHQHKGDRDHHHARTEHVEWIASAACELEPDTNEGNQVEGLNEVLHIDGSFG